MDAAACVGGSDDVAGRGRAGEGSLSARGDCLVAEVMCDAHEAS